MKFKINRDHFSNGIQQVLNVVGTRTTMPILSNVLIKADENGICLMTNNLEVAIQCQIHADVQVQGAVALPVRKLSTIVNSLPSMDVVVDVTPSHQAKITSGGSMFKMMGMAPEEFPPLPTFGEDTEVSFKQDELVQMLKNIAYAQSGDETRYILNGVYFSMQPDKVTLVATDGRRLGMISKDMNIGEKGLGSFILPAKTVSELIRLLGQGASVKLSFSNRQVAFIIEVDGKKNEGLVNQLYLVSKVVDGKYPDYNQVIPKATEHRVKVERELMQECVQRAALVVNEKNHSVRIKIHNNLMEFSAFSPEYGESHESMAIAYEGPEVQVAFNPQYLLDPLKALPKDELFFEFKDELSPGVFKTLDHFLCVIMPLRLS